MDGGATATEHLLGMTDDSGSTRVAGPPSCMSGSRCGVDRTAQPEEDPAGPGTKGSLSAQEVGGRSVLTSPTTRAMCQARFGVLAAVGEVLMATARTPPETSERDIRSQSLTSYQAEWPGADARKNLIISADASGPRGSV